MRKIIASTFFAFLASCASAAQPESEAVEKAQVAAQNWLALVDSNQYSATWEQAALPFQAAIKKPEWENAVMSVRSQVGLIEKRALLSATFTKRLPGAPAGQYVVIQFDSQFANKKNAVETVTPMLDTDGTWRVSGYFIK
jgi:hypothetical protein